MINLIAEVIIVTISSWLLTKKYWGESLFSQFILVWFILFFAQIVLVELFLGIIGQLYFLHVFIVHLSILLVISLIYFRKETPAFKKPNVEPFLNSNLLFFAFSIFVPE